MLLLADVCDLAHREVAALIGRREEACRQLLRRARQRLRRRPESASSRTSSDPVADSSTDASGRPAAVEPELLDRCLDAIRSADHRALVASVLRGEPVVEAPDRIRCIVGPQGELTVRLGHIVLATVTAASCARATAIAAEVVGAGAADRLMQVKLPADRH